MSKIHELGDEGPGRSDDRAEEKYQTFDPQSETLVTKSPKSIKDNPECDEAILETVRRHGKLKIADENKPISKKLLGLQKGRSYWRKDYRRATPSHSR